MKRTLIAVALFIALALFFGILERESVLIGEAILKDPPQIVFQRPLDCDAIVAQRGADEPWVSRCYIKSQP